MMVPVSLTSNCGKRDDAVPLQLQIGGRRLPVVQLNKPPYLLENFPSYPVGVMQDALHIHKGNILDIDELAKMQQRQVSRISQKCQRYLPIRLPAV